MNLNHKIPLYRGELNISDEIKKFDLWGAEQIVISKHGSKNVFKLFEKSGLKLIVKEILYQSGKNDNSLKNKLKYIFVENSLFASTLETQKLSAFTCTWERSIGSKGNELSFMQNVSKNFGDIITKLQKENLALLWHPEFCYNSKEAVAYYSSSKDFQNETNNLGNFVNKFIDFRDRKESNVKQFWKSPNTNIVELDKGNLYVSNSSIPFNYLEFISESRKRQYLENRKVIDLQILNHQLYHSHFLNERESDNLISFFLSIPILSSDGGFTSKIEEKNFKGQGTVFMFLVFENGVSSNEVNGLITELCIRIPRIIKDATPDYLFNVGINLTKKAKKLAMHSAKAAIMGRNMSHNVGSHVLYYLKAYLSSHTSIVGKGVLRDLPISIDGDNLFFQQDRLPINIENLELPFLKGLGRFLTYLQERQDFIATIATTNIPSFISANFKDFIIDNFVPDKKADRHDRQSHGLKKEKNILLDFLVKSENTSVEIKYNGQYLNQSENISDDSRNFEVDIPGGVLGRQAFYSILENIIRNAAKHGDRNMSQTLEIDIRVSSECDPSFYEIMIIDNNSNSGQNKDKINKMLEEDLIDELFRLDENHKGIKEIKISSAWLVGKSITDISDVTEIIQAINFEGQLAFKFWLYKSRKLAVIVEDEFIEDLQNDNIVYKFFSLKSTRNELSELQKYNLVIDMTGDFNPNDFVLKRFITYKINQFPKTLSDMQSLYINAYKVYLETTFKELELDIPFICTDKLEASSKIDIKLSNSDLLKWINCSEGNPVKFKKVDDVFYSQKGKKNRKRIAFRRHLKGENGLSIFFKEQMNFDHNESIIDQKNNILNKVQEAQENYYSIESITGDNSTVRLLFNEEKNDEWILKTVEAGVSEILIIDERLWNQNRFYEPGSLDPVGEKILNWFKELYKNPKIKRLPENYIDEIGIKENKSLIKNEIENIKSKVNINDAISGRRGPWKRLNKHLSEEFTSAKAKFNFVESISQVLNRIKVGNIPNIFDKDLSGKIDIMDLFETRIGIIDVESLEITNINSRPDYITIHQGILDKLYNVHFKHTSNINKYDNGYKKKVIEKIVYEIKLGFKPIKLCVHSGRSKPSYIPDDTAFIPFSGIEYGMNEAKQILLNLIISSQP